ncbi:hypothetical protein T484DRAFT_1762019, partial [Baffinella frigidus]
MRYCNLDAVETAAIDSVAARLTATLEKLCASGFDQERLGNVIERFHERLRNVIERFHVKHLNALEDSPHDTLPYYAISAFLFAEDPSHYEAKLRGVFTSARLLEKPKEFWVDLVRRTMLDVPCVVVRCFPSAAKAVELADAEKARVAERVATLGETGLASLAK